MCVLKCTLITRKVCSALDLDMENELELPAARVASAGVNVNQRHSEKEHVAPCAMSHFWQPNARRNLDLNK